MSITSWSKRSPNNNTWILAVTIAVIALNLYYRDRQTSEAKNVSTVGGDLAVTNASPKVKAFIKMLRWAEGTDGVDGYKTRYTGAKFDDFSDHPRTVLCSEFKGKKLCSNASGAYQFMDYTWDEKAKKLGLKDFSPKNQDIAAIDLLNDVGAIELVEKDNIAGAIANACPKFASFPCSDGDLNGAYNQAVKPMPSLLQRYKENLEQQK